MKRCPRCGVENPDTAEWCGCRHNFGTNFGPAGIDGSSVAPLQSTDAGPNGIGGWLVLFIVTLIGVVPLGGLYNLVREYHQLAPAVARFPGVLTVFKIDAILSTALIAFGMYAGISLLMRRPDAVKTAKNFLLALLGYSVLIIILAPLAGLPAEGTVVMIGAGIKHLFRAAIYVAIWYSYLNKSRRVRVTYAAQANVGVA